MKQTHSSCGTQDRQQAGPGKDLERHIPFGLKGDHLVHVDEVERGLNCGCVCPGCRAPLVARHGEHNVHHFAHANGAGCEGAYETSLHLAAKEVLEDEMRIQLPPVTRKLNNNRAPIQFAPEQDQHIDSIELEKKLGKTIPDITAHIDGSMLAIEIKVTHGIDETKLARIREEGVSTLEIDLSDLPRDLNRDLIRFHVVESIERKTWVYNAYGLARFAQLLVSGKKIPVIERGGALHVDYCPKRQRVWNGKPYANVIDDCLYCEFNLHVGDESIICSGVRRVKQDPMRAMAQPNPHRYRRRRRRL